MAYRALEKLINLHDGYRGAFRTTRGEVLLLQDEGEVLGSVFLVPGEGKGRDRAAKLRLLYVEPAARGAQLGRLLVRECIREARAMGYARLDLWTHDVLRAARAIYASEGFEKISSTRGKGFGGGPTREEVWSLKLRAD